MKKTITIVFMIVLFVSVSWGQTTITVDTTGAPCSDCWRPYSQDTTIFVNVLDTNTMQPLRGAWQISDTSLGLWILGSAIIEVTDSNGIPSDTIPMRGIRQYCKPITMCLNYCKTNCSWNVEGRYIGTAGGGDIYALSLFGYNSTSCIQLTSTASLPDGLMVASYAFDTCCVMQLDMTLWWPWASTGCGATILIWEGSGCNTTATDKPMDTMAIYPNPTQDKVTVKNLPNNATISVIDCLGRTVWSGVSHQIDLSAQAAGLYFLTVATPSGRTAYRVVKE